MGHGKETPRQKMIGLMYLFLTALMALNVSKEVLNSFVYVSNSLEKTVANNKNKNEKVYAEFDKAYMQNQAKVEPWKVKADNVRTKAEELIQMLENHKIDLAKYAEGEETECISEDGRFHLDGLKQKDNIDKGGEYFGPLGKKHGGAIETEIDAYREFLLGIIPDSEDALKLTIETTLATDDYVNHEDITESWVTHTFEHIPLVADFVMLAKLQTDVRNMETDAINYLFGQISAGDFKVNKMDATVIAKSSYVTKGDEYQAEVFIAAYDSTQDPEIYVGSFEEIGDGKYNIPEDAQKLEVVNGKGVYKVPGNVVGERKWGGLIKLKSPNGGESYYPFESEYQVAQSNVVVAPTKMNVFYSGIPNPVDISVPGVPASNVIPRITSGAVISKVAQGYEVKPTKSKGTIKVQVYANMDGQQKFMGDKEFRIRVIPKPVPKIMGKNSGSISKTMLSNAPSVYAELEDFVFDLKFQVTQFNLIATDGKYSNEYLSKSNKFSRDQINAIKAAKKGSRIMIDNIMAKGPDGREVPLSPIVFKLK